MSLPFPSAPGCDGPGATMFDPPDRYYCPDPSQVTPKSCPTGFTEDTSLTPPWECIRGSGVSANKVTKSCPEGYIQRNDVCQKMVIPTCPTGSSFVGMFMKGATGERMGPPQGVCVPDMTPTYIRPKPENIQDSPWPCNGRDPLSPISDTNVKCYRVSGGNESPATATSSNYTPVTSPTFDGLDQTYQRQVAEYEQLTRTALETNDATKLPDIRAKSEQVQDTLNKMIEQLTYLKKETPSIRVERDALLETLRRIQRDYTQMLLNTDDLETLRRIREQESDEGRTQLYRYLAFFILLACTMIIYLMVVGPQRNAVTASTPMISPTLT